MKDFSSTYGLDARAGAAVDVVRLQAARQRFLLALL